MTITAPRGTQDILPPDVEYWEHIERVAAELFARFNYQEVRTPIFEATELFTRSIGSDTDIVEKEMYTFHDKKGRSITLRPEGTASIVRAFIEHNLGAEGSVQKLWYQGPMFRYERPQAGRYRQFHQIGCEVLGTKSGLADAETIQLAVQIFAALGMQDLEVSVNSVGCPVCRPVIREKIKSFLGDSLPHLCEDCQRRFKKNPLRILDCKNKKCRHYLMGIPSMTSALCHDCHDHFQTVISMLDLMGVQYKHNPGLVRGLDYYTKTVYEVVSKHLGAQDAVCGGGRYDNLVKTLGGPDVPAVGFAFGMERTVMVLQEQKIALPARSQKKVICAALGQAAREKLVSITQQLRAAGVQADLEFDDKGLKAQMKRADRFHADYVVIMGDDEVEKKVVQLKNMRTGEQIEVSTSDILSKLI